MMNVIFLALSTFLASAVEMVEALTIVLAVGITRGWRSPLIGVVVALGALTFTVAIFGPALVLIPINILRLVVGTIILIFGLQWLRKAVLRAGGFKALHDEDAIFQREVAAARVSDLSVRAGMDWYAFTLSFKGVFLEGLEVAFIVLTFGTTQGSVPVAAAGAGAAVVLVGIAGVLLHQPLSKVPENAMKFAVGALLVSFGTFWSVEGVGVEWPGSDTAILGILAVVLVCSAALVTILRRQHLAAPVVTASH